MGCLFNPRAKFLRLGRENAEARFIERANGEFVTDAWKSFTFTPKTRAREVTRSACLRFLLRASAARSLCNGMDARSAVTEKRG